MTTPSSSTCNLAIDGGQPAFPHRHGKKRPKIGIEEFLSVAERFGLSTGARERIRSIVEAEDWGDGPTLSRYATAVPSQTKGEEFERLARELFGVPHALSLSSGTAALHAACVAAGVGPGREVIVPAVGYSATATAVVISRGVPIFCDVDESLCIDPARIAPLITPRTVAIAPTCVMGVVPDLEPILAIAAKHKLRVIEDCAQAPGAKYRGRHAGTWGDLGCFSISAYKIVGGGEGGLVLTADERLYDRARQLAECGGLWRPDRFSPPRYAGELFCGTNYRMSELEAAVDAVQLRKMPDLVRRYGGIKRGILGRLKTFREIVPQRSNDMEGDAGYNLRFFPQTVELGRRIAAALNAEGIGVGRFIWPAQCGIRGEDAPPDWHLYSDMFPVRDQSDPSGMACPFRCPHYLEAGGQVTYPRNACPVATDLYNRNVMIWLDPDYDETDCEVIAAGINKVLSAYCTEDTNARPWL